MIGVNKEDQVVINHNDKSYCLKNPEEYQKLVILITDPKIELDGKIFEVDKDITDSRLKAICTKYKEFFESFKNSKAQIIEQAKLEVEQQLLTKAD